jgi:hypothetical protein
MIKNTLLMVLGIFTMMGCNPEYAIVGEIGKEYIFIEVPEDEKNEDIWVDSFIQPESTEGVDILWVIDRSCSMRDNEPLLFDGIDAMINSLPSTGWRLNMISNSPPNVLNESSSHSCPETLLLTLRQCITKCPPAHMRWALMLLKNIFFITLMLVSG